MKVERMVNVLEEVVCQFGLAVRWEKGRFRGGRCQINGEDLIMLNKHHPPEVHLAILAESLRDLPLETVFLPPAVREAIEAAWRQPRESLPDVLGEPEEADVD